MENVLVAPLNWGLGHAARCVPLIRRQLAAGNRVYLAAEGNARALLSHYFPQLPFVELSPSFSLRYNNGSSQTSAIVRALPRLLWCSLREHRALPNLIKKYQITQVISDNRFGLWCSQCPCIYLTHQLNIRLPRPWRWLEPLAGKLHQRLIKHYTQCWIPDFENLEQSLGGWLSHPSQLPPNTRYIGPLSQFNFSSPKRGGGTVLLLSGVEPQRSLWEQQLISQYKNHSQAVLLIRGSSTVPPLHTDTGVIQVWDMPDNEALGQALSNADLIVVRSGYSSIMDLYQLGKLDSAQFYPTPGQSEQEYLAKWITKTN